MVAPKLAPDKFDAKLKKRWKRLEKEGYPFETQVCKIAGAALTKCQDENYRTNNPGACKDLAGDLVKCRWDKWRKFVAAELAAGRPRPKVKRRTKNEMAIWNTAKANRMAAKVKRTSTARNKRTKAIRATVPTLAQHLAAEMKKKGARKGKRKSLYKGRAKKRKPLLNYHRKLFRASV